MEVGGPVESDVAGSDPVAPTMDQQKRFTCQHCHNGKVLFRDERSPPQCDYCEVEMVPFVKSV